MKTVLGKVVSSQPISLSKAAKDLGRFTASDNEASLAFNAYLRRTTATFNELAQLHKKYKIPLDQVKAKEDHSEGVVTQGTSNSGRLAGEVVGVQGTSEGRKREGRDLDGSHAGLSIHKASKNGRDEFEERHYAGSSQIDNNMKSSGCNTNRNSADVGGDGKKSKKKSRLGSQNVDQADGDHGAINVVEVKSEMKSLDGSEDLQKEKKQKRDKHKTQNSDAALESGNEVLRADGVGDVADTVQNIGDTHKKHKKQSKIGEDDGNIKNEAKEEMEHSSMKSAELRGDANAGSIEEISDWKKHKKKRSHEPEERETGIKIETQAAEKKASKKRKYEKVADGGLDASPEAVRSKKKKDKR